MQKTPRKSPKTKKRAVAHKLARYDEKRDFTRTREPSSRAKLKQEESSTEGALFRRKKSALPRFMVHKHDANRLHYDLRLETDGVLASWAIPKGPSYDPAEKRLAVRTEDHPLAYGDFEGRIPDGEYGGGDSLVWERGHYDTVPPGAMDAQLKKGHLRIKLDGQKLQGEWHLVRTRPQGSREQWLCFKAKDGTERTDFDVIAERPESVASGRHVTRGPVRKAAMRAKHPRPETILKKVWPPMLATLSSLEAIKDPESYVLELKYDGYRGLACVSGGEVSFQTRNAIDLAARFPAIAQALPTVSAAEVVLDGEVVAVDERGIPRFHLIGDAKAPKRFVVFDLLWLDGEDVRERSLEDRRELLESVMGNVKPPLELSQRIDREMDVALRAAKSAGYEGLMAKRIGSAYVAKRSDAWRKLKVQENQEVAIVGFTPITNGTNAIGALLLGIHDGNAFQYVGKVGTGFSSELRAELLKTLKKSAVDSPPVSGAPRLKGATWVKPELVAQVSFTEWTRDGSLRHPSFLGLREDKSPKECKRERR